MPLPLIAFLGGLFIGILITNTFWCLHPGPKCPNCGYIKYDVNLGCILCGKEGKNRKKD